jgi:hypothetical protein
MSEEDLKAIKEEEEKKKKLLSKRAELNCKFSLKQISKKKSQ